MYGKACTLVRFHQCYLCRRLVRHEYKAIYQHILRHRQYDMEKYARQFETRLRQAGYCSGDVTILLALFTRTYPITDRYLIVFFTRSSTYLLNSGTGYFFYSTINCNFTSVSVMLWSFNFFFSLFLFVSFLHCLALYFLFFEVINFNKVWQTKKEKRKENCHNFSLY